MAETEGRAGSCAARAEERAESEDAGRLSSTCVNCGAERIDGADMRLSGAGGGVGRTHGADIRRSGLSIDRAPAATLSATNGRTRGT